MMVHALQTTFRRAVSALMVAGMALASFSQPALANSRIKDIASFEGVRENILVGYGLVVGLNGTGDDLRKSVFTRESLVGMLERLGVNARDNRLEVDNIAAVMVTAVLPPFSRQGTKIDVSISTIGDASNLLGGTLLVTPMIAADGEVYAVAQGPIAVSGFAAQGAASSVTRGVPTAGRIANGAIVEREVPFQMAQMETVNVALRNPDFTTARRIAQAVNAFIGQPIAQPLDPGTVRMTIPSNYTNNAVGLITDIEQLRVSPDQVAKVVIDEKSGVIVMGENVRINTVAIAQGNLTIRITETPQVSQPNPFSQGGQTVVVPRTQIDIQEDENRRLTVLPSGVTLQELVDGLNALGVGPRDMISILQAIKASGALQADIEII
ncbi:MAG: flagellar basal body P-ring protein FlgI [Alphaproteobacteria bacterium]|nr:flagellar basal body P-ring protein FlgI [Alphaproteobacteria bacterium]MBU0797017.1 flagellar basal body P-ring protein FlgI [Alphaproteobacteria bacterium]MBU0886576.1 flagellar basal body P-ring protein FlgI [Alphaproteobacteria bacterium]MBU1814165.1 flagellar basal body P-ring protein FlgI [Alphaproteobacteria bacterium]MBU2089320.1 flagellar basal body P-ring protein FlgI [Alphaproteobacteria bacterium]